MEPMINFFAWNTRGFNKMRKQTQVKVWIEENKPSFGCLLETRVQKENSPEVLQRVFPQWKSVTNYEHNRLGRIWLLWNGEVEVTPKFIGSQVITALVKIPSGVEFITSAVYASNFQQDRVILWNEILHHRNSLISPDMPWVMLGDFNQIYSIQDHSNAGTIRGSQSGMREFQNMITECDLDDLEGTGPQFTWWNHCPTNPISKKLDRVMVNEAWKTVLPFAYSAFEPNGISDHLRSVVRLMTGEERKRPHFQFFNFLIQAPGFMDIVSRYWDSTEPLFVSKTTLIRFHKKLKGLKPILRGLNKEKYGALPLKTRRAFQSLCDAQEKALMNPCSETFEEENRASGEWNRLAALEECFFQQKSRISWLKNGDHNTSTFHRSVQARASRNRIFSITKMNGEVVTDKMEIKTEATKFFHNNLNSNIDQGVPDFSQDIRYKCSRDVEASLTARVTPEEIKQTLFSMPANKAPGPDGYTSEFFIASWPVVGADFTMAVQSFFTNGFMPKSINATTLVLIPKKEETHSFNDYRPIACCNTIYKVISKILANRLKAILPDAVERNQCAFIKGRMLLENVLLATELVKNYHRGAGTSRSVLKLDISKAFDSVKWEAIISALQAMNVPDRFIFWVTGCISTSAFSVSINGELDGFFTSNRGLRQGCALSPYLFVIVLNALSNKLNKAAQHGVIGFHPKCKALNLNHLCFADDLMIFTDGSPESIKGTMAVLDGFARESGLYMNPSKSSFYMGGKDRPDTVRLISSLGIPQKSLPIKYLGLPLTTKSMTTLDYEPLVSSIRNRMLAWSNRKLSFAGRLQLIQAVVKSVINFWSSVFRLPGKCLKTIDGLCSAFLWSGSPNVTSKSKVAWQEVCTRKITGGLGVRRLKDSAKVFSLNLIWRVVASPESLWVSWINRYVLRGTSFWEAKATTCGSWIWNKLLKLKALAKGFVSHKINSGESTSFWDDNWTGKGRLIEITGDAGVRRLGIPRSSKVHEVVSARGWCFRRCRDPLLQSLVSDISILPLPDPILGQDVIEWKHGTSDFKPNFSAKKTWDQICPAQQRVTWGKVVWFGQAIPRQSFLAWITIKNRLATGDRARRWGQIISCVLCGDRNESRDHLFFACPYSYTIWTSIARRITRHLNPDWEITLRDISGTRYSKVDSILYRVIFQATIYHIWRERNNRRHNRHSKQISTIIASINLEVTTRISTLTGDFATALKTRWASVSAGN